MPGNLPQYEATELAALGVSQTDMVEAVADLNANARRQFTTPDRFPFTNEPFKVIDGVVYVHADFMAIMREAKQRGALEGL